MAVFSAYFDASGDPSDGAVLFVSGFVSSEAKWLKFEMEWNGLLRDYGIRPPFHMREFAPGVRQYAAWKDDKARRDAFLAAAVQIIKRRTHKSISSGVILRDLRQVNREYRTPPHMAYPYAVCGASVVARVMGWVRRRAIRGQLGLVFEDGDRQKGKLLEFLHGVHVPATFLPKAASSAFQAADFLAWEHHRYWRDRVARERGEAVRPVRRSLAALTIQLPHEASWGIHDRASLVRWCESHHLPRR